MSSHKSFSDRVDFDFDAGEIRDGSARYMMIRPDGLMGLFRQLDDDARAQALVAFAQSIYEHGGRSAQSYRDQQLGMGDSEAEQLLDVIADTAPRLGWGRWTFDRVDADTLRLAVRNSPFAAGYGETHADAAVCAPICGMFKAVSEMLFGSACDVDEERCAAVHAGPASAVDLAVCKFIAKAQR